MNRTGTTLVTAFISNMNVRTDRNSEDYVRYGRSLLELPIPKVVFIEEKYKDLAESLSHPMTTIITFEKEELDFYDEVNSTELELPAFRNPEKDTANYFLLMSNKTLFCKRAIELDPYNSLNFIWMDFGISHILRSDEPLASLIRSEYSFLPGKVRAGGIWSEEIARQFHRPFNQINWFFSGGVFAGDSESLTTFYESCSSQFRENLNLGKITWEVNLWRQVYEKDPSLFDVYQSDHNGSLISNL